MFEELENPKLVEALDPEDPEIGAENCPNPKVVVDGKEKAEADGRAREVLRLPNTGVCCEEEDINGETCETGVSVKDTKDVVDRDDTDGETCETDVWAKEETEVTVDKDRFGLDEKTDEDKPGGEAFTTSDSDCILVSGLPPNSEVFRLLCVMVGALIFDGFEEMPDDTAMLFPPEIVKEGMLEEGILG